MTNIYVSCTGEGDGSQNSPCSLDAAKMLVRANNESMNEDINVIVGQGTYALTEPLVLDSRDSGNNSHRVHWQSEEGARAEMTGAVAINGWTLHDQEKNIWQAKLAGTVDFEHLWVDGQRCNRASSSWKPKGLKNSRKGVKFDSCIFDISNWKNPTEIVITKRMMWRSFPAKVHALVGNELRLDPQLLKEFSVPYTALGVMDPIAIRFLLNGIEMVNATFMIENAYELLTDEGEWYLDKSSSIVYYKPRSNEGFNETSSATFADTKTFFLLDGNLQNPVENITISGFKFCYSKGSNLGVTSGFPTEPTKRTSIKPENAVQVNAGRNIVIENNLFTHLGCDGLHFDLHGRDIRITGNGFSDISRAAISLSQTNLVVNSKSKKGILPENKDKFFDNVDINNNYIRKTGMNDISPAITFSDFARNIRCFHNDIADVPIQAIRNSWRYLGWRDHAGDIEYAWNKTARVGRAGLHDFGSLYISCSNVGEAKVHHNFIDGVGLSPNNAGIYFDVNVENGSIYNNVSINMPSAALTIFPRGWVAMVICRKNKIFNNWSDSLFSKDFDQSRYRFFWRDKTNEFFDNHLIDGLKNLPTEAQEVVDNAGLEKTYQPMVELVEQTLVAKLGC